MTILRNRKPREGFVRLSAVIITNQQTLEKSVSIVEGGGPCGILEEKWFGVIAFGSTKTDTYKFNGQRIKGRENVVSRMKEYVTSNYSHFLS